MPDPAERRYATTTDFLGAWKLLSWTIELGEGSIMEPFGSRPLGIIAYTDAGTVHATFSRRGRSRLGLDLNEIQAVRRHLLGIDRISSGIDIKSFQDTYLRAALEFNAYCGTYSIEGNRILHHVKVSVIPEWEDHSLARSYAFDKDRLILSTDAKGHKDRLVWQRMSAAADAHTL